MRIDLPNPEEFKVILEQVSKQTIKIAPTGVTLDSREAKKGDLYIAIKGENVDGHRYIQAASKNGCVAAIVKRKDAQAGLNQIQVTDPAKTIAQVAKKWRSNFSLPVLGITGSNGKTTTKDLLIQIFSANYSVHGTRGNYNTHLGLPLTLLELTPLHNFSILEMGANEKGDIGYLCNLGKPLLGLITNIAAAHLEGFGSLENVVKTKEELFLSLPDNGIAFVNHDDEWIRSMSTICKKITFGFSPNCDFTADLYRDESGLLTLTINGEEIALHSYNETFAKNVVAASSVSITLGISWETFQETVFNFSPSNGRCVVKEIRGVTIIDDTYNANLFSTLSALDFLYSLPTKGNRFVVFGDMLELGDESEAHHRQVGVKCTELGVDRLLCFGTETKATVEAADSHIDVRHYSSKNSLSKDLMNMIKKGDVLLFKGSRGMTMETIIQEVFEE